MMAMENREQCVERELNVGEAKISNNLKKAKKKFKERVKRGQEMRQRELMEIQQNEMNEDSEVNGKKKKELM